MRNSASKPKSRFFRFSLKTLLAFMLVSGIVLGVVIPGQQRAKRETEAVKLLYQFLPARTQSDTVQVYYDFQAHKHHQRNALSPSSSQIGNPDATNPMPQWLTSLVGENTFAHVAAIRLDTVNNRFGNNVKQDKAKVVEALGPFKDLEFLQLRIGNGCPDDLYTIGRIENLRGFEFDACFRLKSLAGIENLRQLEVLRLRNVGISSGQRLASLRKLRHLELSWALELDSLDFLPNLTQLESLNLGNLRLIKKFDFEQLLNNKQLKQLQLRGFEGLANTHRLADLTKLETLSLVACDGLVSVDEIAKASSVNQLRLENCRSLISLADIKAMTQLEEVTIDRCDSLPDLAPLSDLEKLKKLTLSGLEARRLPKLESLRSLETLVIAQMESLESLDELANLDASNLKSILIKDCPSLTSVAALDSIESIAEINIEGCPGINPEHIQLLTDASSNVKVHVR